MPFDTVHFAAM